MRKIKESKESRNARRKRERENQPKKESSRFGFFIVVVCAAAIALSFVSVARIDPKEPTEPDPIDVTTVNSRALSTSWTCPYMGEAETNNLVIVNPLENRSALIRITSHTSEGEQIYSDTIEVGSLSKTVVDLSSYRSDSNFVLFVESFSAPVAVFRNIELSDGFEFPPCLPFTSSKAVFPSLTTERLSNSILYLANPFKEAVVVDISATLSNGSGETLTVQSDQISGQVIPARGRTIIDLQNPEAFGRFSDISLTINSRSGFFVSEVLMQYNGARGATGETVVLPSRELVSEFRHVVPGVSPTKIVGANASNNAGAISVGTFAADARSFLNEPLNFVAGSTLQLSVPGEDFGLRAISFLLERGGTKNNMYTAWNHISADAVSSGEGALLSTTDKILPMYGGDTLEFYNANNKTVEVEIEIFGSNVKKTIELKPNSYVSQALVELPESELSIVRVISGDEIFSASSGPQINRHNVGITIAK